MRRNVFPLLGVGETHVLLTVDQSNRFWKHLGIPYALVANLQESCILKILPTICRTELSICRLINDPSINALHTVL